jgi:hypothetical protein
MGMATTEKPSYQYTIIDKIGPGLSNQPINPPGGIPSPAPRKTSSLSDMSTDQLYALAQERGIA